MEETSVTLRIARFRLVETAESYDQWTLRAHRQWGYGRPLAFRASTASGRLGTTVPQTIQWGSGGIVLSPDVATFDISKESKEGGAEDILIEVLEVPPIPPLRSLAFATLSLGGFVASGGHYARYSLHALPPIITDACVHAVIDVELRAHEGGDGEGGSPKTHVESPLEYVMGRVRLSTMDLYFPSFLMVEDILISNVVCVANIDDHSLLSMQLTPPSGSGGGYAGGSGGGNGWFVQPSTAVLVRPRQRAYFSLSWAMSDATSPRTNDASPTTSGAGGAGGSTSGGNAALSHWGEAQLIVTSLSAEDPPQPPVTFRLHPTPPRADLLHAPYHYWVNATVLTNRTMHAEREVPYVRSILPVFLVHAVASGALQAVDKDSGRSCVVLPSGGIAMQAAIDGSAGDPQQRSGGGPTIRRGVRVVAPDEACECVLYMGVILDLPVWVARCASTPTAPVYRVAATAIGKGWQVVREVTDDAYQSLNGALRWSVPLVVRRQGGASATQFVRLTLVEVASTGSDAEDPVATATLSLHGPDSFVMGAVVPLRVAFWVMEHASQYDEIKSLALVMRGATLAIRES